MLALQETSGTGRQEEELALAYTEQMVVLGKPGAGGLEEQVYPSGLLT